MAGFDRDEPVWYYQLGGKALGPVPWSEIEELLEDAFEAEDLLVARGGDDTWRSAQQVIDEFEKDEPDEDEAEADEEPDEKVEEEPREPLTPVLGLKAWIGQAWGIISDDLRQYLVGSIMVLVLSSVSLMICFPALYASFYSMALKRFRGEKLGSSDFTSGFHFFGRALGLYAVIFLIGLPGAVIAVFGAAVLLTMLPEDSAARSVLMLTSWLFWLVASLVMSLPGAAAFFAMPLMVDRDMGAMEALRASWEVTRRHYFSYLGMTLVLSLLSGLGGAVCWIGLVFTLPILPVAQVCAYRYHFRDAA